MYLPTVARWMTTDPLKMWAGLNYFMYVLNSPVRFRDVTGGYVEAFGINVPFLFPVLNSSQGVLSFAKDNSTKGDPVKICVCVCNGKTIYTMAASNATCDNICKQNMGQNCEGEDFPEPDLNKVNFYITRDAAVGACPCDHEDLATTLPGGSGFILRIGFGGGDAPGQYPKPGPRDLKICVLNEKWRPYPGTIGHGAGAGKSCTEATAIEIMDCISKRPAPEGDYNPLTNNCQHDVRATMRACCLEFCDDRMRILK